MMNRFDHPLYYWHLEVTTKCALACSRCPRTGEANKKNYQLTSMTEEFVRKVFPPEFVKDEMKIVLFCGGHGDPIYCPDLLKIIRYLREHNPKIHLRFVTNGSYKKEAWWQEFSSLLTKYDTVAFSIDGWDQKSNEKYREKSNFQSIQEGLTWVAKSPANVIWSSIAFSFNIDNIDQIKEQAKLAGCDSFVMTKSTKFGQPWHSSYEEDPLWPNHQQMSKVGFYQKAITHFKNETHSGAEIQELIQEKGLEVSKAYKSHPIVPRCRYSEKGYYINASGILFPCSWMSHPQDMALKPGQENLWVSHRDSFDLKNRSLEEVLNDSIWQRLFQSWKTLKDCYSECESKCGRTELMTHPIVKEEGLYEQA